MKPKLVLIEWEDSYFPASCRWESVEGVKAFYESVGYMISSVGWIIAQDKTSILLSPTISFDSGNYQHLQRIPKGTIRKKVILDG